MGTIVVSHEESSAAILGHFYLKFGHPHCSLCAVILLLYEYWSSSTLLRYSCIEKVNQRLSCRLMEVELSRYLRLGALVREASSDGVAARPLVCGRGMLVAMVSCVPGSLESEGALERCVLVKSLCAGLVLV